MVDDFHWTTTTLATASCEELRRKVFFGENFRLKKLMQGRFEKISAIELTYELIVWMLGGSKGRDLLAPSS